MLVVLDSATWFLTCRSELPNVFVLIAKCISQNCKIYLFVLTVALHQAFDFVCLSGSVENRLVEWVDHLHQHFKCPPRVENGRCVEATDHLMMTICGLDDNECRYVTPLDAGYSTEFVEESLADHIYPTGRLVLRFVSYIICTQMEGSLSSSYDISYITYLPGWISQNSYHLLHKDLISHHTIYHICAHMDD